MRVITYARYGGPEVLRLEEHPRPVADEDRLVIKVVAAGVNHSDWESLTARPVYVRLAGNGLRRPKSGRLGSDVAGVVEEVGPAVTDFSPGDEVFGDLLWHAPATFADYVRVRQTAPLVTKPPGLSFEQAAAIPQAAGLAYQALTERGGIQPGQRVLVNGAGGGGGTFAVQLAVQMGADVTGVDTAQKLETMRTAGAEVALDHRTEDFSKLDRRYDRILDFAGRRSILPFRRVLRPGGSYLMIGGTMPRLLQVVTLGTAITKLTDVTMRVMMAKPNRDDLATLGGMVEAGEIATMIDRTYPLEDVAAAMRRLGEGQALGKLVITT